MTIDDIASKLLAARKLRGLRQEAVAAIFGVTQGTIARWERGEVTPQSEHFWALAEFISVIVPGASHIENAIEAAAKSLHDQAREKRMFRWETMPEGYRDNIRAFVRPMVEAALEAADAHDLAIVTAKPKGK